MPPLGQFILSRKIVSEAKIRHTEICYLAPLGLSILSRNIASEADSHFKQIAYKIIPHAPPQRGSMAFGEIGASEKEGLRGTLQLAGVRGFGEMTLNEREMDMKGMTLRSTVTLEGNSPERPKAQISYVVK